ncbi:MAG: GspH/FimT family pseudopilin [Planifilum fimeticola]|jgi:Tfp pilus assembly protein FimT
MGMDDRRREEGGWTLLELVLTVSLIGLLAALAAPAFHQIGERLERKLTLDTLASDIRLAQREAESREAVTELRIDPSGGGYRVVRGGKAIRRASVRPRYRLTSNYPSGRILFRPSGQVRGGTLWLERDGKRVGRVVIQVASGRPRVEVDP